MKYGEAVMTKRLFCTIDLGMGKVGQVFGWHPDLTVIDMGKGKIRGLNKKPEYLEYESVKAEIPGSDKIVFEDGSFYKIIKKFREE
jgi:hypothetical protein